MFIPKQPVQMPVVFGVLFTALKELYVHDNNRDHADILKVLNKPCEIFKKYVQMGAPTGAQLTFDSNTGYDVYVEYQIWESMRKQNNVLKYQEVRTAIEQVNHQITSFNVTGTIPDKMRLTTVRRIHYDRKSDKQANSVRGGSATLTNISSSSKGTSKGAAEEEKSSGDDQANTGEQESVSGEWKTVSHHRRHNARNENAKSHKGRDKSGHPQRGRTLERTSSGGSRTSSDRSQTPGPPVVTSSLRTP